MFGWALFSLAHSQNFRERKEVFEAVVNAEVEGERRPGFVVPKGKRFSVACKFLSHNDSINQIFHSGPNPTLTNINDAGLGEPL